MIFPAKHIGSLSQNHDWRSPLSLSEKIDNSGGFFISKPGDYEPQTRGNLDVRTITVETKAGATK